MEIERHKGVPLDGKIAHAEGFARKANPFITPEMRAKWRAQFMTAEADAGHVADSPMR